MGFVFILKKGVCGPLLNGTGFLILFPNGVGLCFILKSSLFIFSFKKGRTLVKKESVFVFKKKGAVFLTRRSAAIYKALAVSISKRVGFDF